MSKPQKTPPPPRDIYDRGALAQAGMAAVLALWGLDSPARAPAPAPDRESAPDRERAA